MFRSDATALFSFFLSLEEGEYFLKVLIPSYAAGSIIGKGGQTIVQLQKETGATIKLSKSKDFYPGEFSKCVSPISVHILSYTFSLSFQHPNVLAHCYHPLG